MRHVEVLGVPFNSAGRLDGVARAPAALRTVGLIDRLRASGIEAADTGDVPLGPTTPARDQATHIIAPSALATMISAVRTEVDAIVRNGLLPLVLGGDCPVLLGCLDAHLEDAPLGVLFVDGHEDAWPPRLSTSGEAADMALGFALGLTIADVPKDLLSEIPRLDPERVVVAGARDGRELAEAGVPSVHGLVRMVSPEALAANPSSIAADETAYLARHGPWWLHVDLDVLSTRSLSAVDYRQPGGVGWDALTKLTRQALASPGVVGWDVTIYNPASIRSGRTRPASCAPSWSR